MSDELAKALIQLAGSLAWPGVVAWGLNKFHGPLSRLVDRFKSGEGLGVKIETGPLIEGSSQQLLERFNELSLEFQQVATEQKALLEKTLDETSLDPKQKAALLAEFEKKSEQQAVLQAKLAEIQTPPPVFVQLSSYQVVDEEHDLSCQVLRFQRGATSGVMLRLVGFASNHGTVRAVDRLVEALDHLDGPVLVNLSHLRAFDHPASRSLQVIQATCLRQGRPLAFICPAGSAGRQMLSAGMRVFDTTQEALDEVLPAGNVLQGASGG